MFHPFFIFVKIISMKNYEKIERVFKYVFNEMVCAVYNEEEKSYYIFEDADFFTKHTDAELLTYLPTYVIFEGVEDSGWSFGWSVHHNASWDRNGDCIEAPFSEVSGSPESFSDINKALHALIDRIHQNKCNEVFMSIIYEQDSIDG
jgi:hypothetical protein